MNNAKGFKRKNYKLLKSLVAVLVLVSMFIAPISTATLQAQTVREEINVGPTEHMKDGAILHAWSWSFNTIKDNMKNIADAGYTSVQTSPINKSVVGNGGDLKFTDQWWYHYQPTEFTIGNYQLGTEAEFAAMCAEAKKHGIRIVVDVVANHFTSDYSAISQNVTNIPNFFRTNKEIENWGDRREVTQKALLGLWDINTHNPVAQNYVKDYLVRCVQLGASGFRYDAAKHIELPDDHGFGSNFWPVVLNNGAEFQYGEVLQDPISRDSDYARYMAITASNYGQKIRDHVRDNNFNVSRLMNYDSAVNPDKLVTWVESHDNYANSTSDWGTSQWMNDEQLKLAWAIIGARAEGAPLFFSRPVGGGGEKWDNRFPEITKLGDRGSDLFMNDQVVAVNKFRNAMHGQGENLRNLNNNNQLLAIERGNKGLVIINASYQNTHINTGTNLTDGNYTNRTNDNSQFTVSNGNISGTLPARSVIVLYKGTETEEPVEPEEPEQPVEPEEPVEGKTFYFEKPDHWGSRVNAYVYDETNGVKELASWPGVEMKNEGNKGYSYTMANDFANPLIIFNDGNKQSPGSGKKGFSLIAGAIYDINGLKSKPGDDAGSKDEITIYYKTNWSNANMHYRVANGQWTNAPGAKMDNAQVDGYKKITVEMDSKSNLTACFNNGSSWDNNNSKDYNFSGPGIYTVENNRIKSGAPEVPVTNTITVYYKTHWHNANMHYQIGNGQWTNAPGVRMDNANGYKVISVDLGKQRSLRACFNNNGQWDNNNRNDYYFNAPGTYRIENGQIYNGGI